MDNNYDYVNKTGTYGPDEESKWSAVRNPDLLPEELPQNREYPSAEAAFLRQAITTVLTKDQYEIWQMYAYDKITLTAIAKKLKTSQPNISQKIKRMKKQLETWCEEHMEIYKTIKESEQESNDL